MPKNKAINLLPQEEFEGSVIGRILRWTMGTFRIIVIVTEMIVMGAFLSRFWLDAQNSDLTSAIKVKSAQITAQSDIEKQFRDIQSKLAIFGQLTKDVKASQKTDGIIAELPPGITLTGIAVSQDSTQINGSSGSEQEIAQFLANLDNDSTFKTVELGQINSSESSLSQIVFSIKVTY